MVRTTMVILFILLASGLTGCTIPIGKHNGDPIVEIHSGDIVLSEGECDECQSEHANH